MAGKMPALAAGDKCLAGWANLPWSMIRCVDQGGSDLISIPDRGGFPPACENRFS